MATAISPKVAFERLSSGEPPLYLDVRTASEFAAGHVPNAVNVPVMAEGGVAVQSFVEDAQAAIKDASSVIVGCKSGKRSTRAIDMLKSAGVEGPEELDGGFDSWLSSPDLPVEM